MNSEEKLQAVAELLIIIHNKLQLLAPAEVDDRTHTLLEEVGAIARGEL